MPTEEQCRECHKANPELINCNPFETDEYYSDDYCLFNVDDDYIDEDYEEEL